MRLIVLQKLKQLQNCSKNVLRLCIFLIDFDKWASRTTRAQIRILSCTFLVSFDICVDNFSTEEIQFQVVLKKKSAADILIEDVTNLVITCQINKKICFE